MRNLFVALLTGLVLLPGAGCRQAESSPPAPAAAAPARSPDTVAHVYWQGKNDLGILADAHLFSVVLNLPETLALQNQMLDKLATAPWRLSGGENEGTNLYHLLLRPMLNDLVRDECYFEVRRPPNQPAQFVFAIRLDPWRVGLWETNSANVLRSLTGVWPLATADHGWTLRRQTAPELIELARVGDWTLIGATHDRNQLLKETSDLVRRGPDPFGARAKGHWLEVDLDLQRLDTAPATALSPASNRPAISLALSGDGANILIHAELIFPRPLPIQFAPWSIPTQRIAEPLVSFTALRGLKSALASWKPWQDLQLGPPPDQLCLWSPDGIPHQVLLAASAPGAGELVPALTSRLLQQANPWLTNHGVGQFEPLPESKGVIWTGLPSITPFVRSVDDGRMIICGLDPSVAQGTNTQAGVNLRPSLAALLEELSTQTNLVAYDWELSAPRVEACLFISQVMRLASRRPQLSLDSAGVEWLRVIKDRLGNATTRITFTPPNRLALDRKATVGLTGAELNLLAAWLESRRFPWWNGNQP